VTHVLTPVVLACVSGLLLIVMVVGDGEWGAALTFTAVYFAFNIIRHPDWLSLS
jgi:hypothetical protein